MKHRQLFDKTISLCWFDNILEPFILQYFRLRFMTVCGTKEGTLNFASSSSLTDNFVQQFNLKNHLKD